jgi:hypothetical protein
VVLALSAIAPVRNYDLFWHLATGRWITEHRALPEVDPFAVASDRRDWVNGEWLYQVAAHALEQRVGVKGLSVVRGLLAALIFTLAFVFSRRTRDPEPAEKSAKKQPVEDASGSALLVTAIAFAGAMATFDFRPSSVALLFAVLALASRSTLAHAAIALLWINVHPSALLAPGIAAVRTRRVAPTVASALALLINPHGWQAVLAPLHLMSFVQSGAFVNAEWLPSRIAQFPLLYLLVAAGAVALLVYFAGRRDEWWRLILFALFAYLAIRHVRNQGLFYSAFPLLVAPSMPRLRKVVAYSGATLAIAFAAFTTDHRLGVAPERFPLRAVARLQASGLPGNIYNPDQFGGLLIWTFYPERRALTDGRNELYRRFIPEYARARGDQRAWRALLEKYRIDLAVDEYRPPLQVVDAVTRQQRAMPASLAYWPRREWALIGYDRAGMVFARRAAFTPEEIAKWERQEVPDAR